MTHFNAYNPTASIKAWKKQAIGVLMLVLLTPGQVTFAQSVSQEAPAAVMTASQPDLAEDPSIMPVPDVTPPTVQEVLLDVCKDNGYGEDCAKTLLGMLWTESSNRSTVIGDGGRARGYFQIHFKMHKISTACAEDLVCSANWTLNYLERNSYPKYVNYAIQCHNSCNVKNGYAAKVVRHAKYFWNKPLAVDQAAPIALAMN